MLPPRRFVQVIAIFLLGIQGLAFLGIIGARLRRAFRRRAAGSIGAGDSAIPPTSHSSSGGSFADK
jgi:hypothetical protein